METTTWDLQCSLLLEVARSLLIQDHLGIWDLNNLVNVSITGSKPLPSLASLSLMLSGVEAKDKSQDDVSGGTLQKQERHVLKMNTPHTKKDGFGAVSDDSLFYRSPHYGVDWEFDAAGDRPEAELAVEVF